MAKLARYRAKRNFAETSEPQGGDGAGTADGHSFVIQKHAASRLHYDLRLELDGVMKSWAVAKGPSLVPGEKRLAVHVEDHPIEYNTFEGTIPKGQYGGGTVLLWDRGVWEPEGDPERALRKGHLDFTLKGEKLAGRWHLVRLKPKGGEKAEPWLLIKSDDEAARQAADPDILDEMPLSVDSGRDLDAIATAKDGAVWQSNRSDAPSEKDDAPKAPSRSQRSRTKKAQPATADTPSANGTAGNDRLPDTLEPALASLAEAAPNGPLWLHEIKWDGYRLLAFKTGKRTRLLTRRGLDWTNRFPSIAAAIDKLPAATAILDGEAIIEDERGLSNFSAMQEALSDQHGRIAHEACLVAFDLLYADGHDLRSLPLGERKEKLATLIGADPLPHLRYGEHLDDDGPAMLRSACGLGLEGIVSKRRDRPYRSGRNRDWLKVKCADRQEFVVVGFAPSKATASAIGSLALAVNEAGGLRHVGRAGTGYTASVARDLYRRLKPLKQTKPTVAGPLTAEERRGITWVEPQLVAEIEFRGWTGDRHLRHAAFKGLREDKDPAEVIEERAPAEKTEPARKAATSQPRAGRSASRIRSSNGGEVAGVGLTHPDRVLWPDTGLTKQGLAEFYEAIAEWLLPELVGRPLSLVRCPSGTEGGCFFQKHSWAGLGDAIGRATVEDDDGPEEVLFVEDIRGVVSLVQASVLEIHAWGSTMRDPERANRIVIDLDPGPGITFNEVIAAATEVRQRLSDLRLESFVKTTGGKGLHVVLPFKAGPDWATVKAFAKSVADAMSADNPARYLATASKAARANRIYVDYLRNGRGATAITAYSTRARPGATVSVPVEWKDLDGALDPGRFTVASLPAALRRRRHNPWADIDKITQSLPAVGKPARRRR